MRALLIEDDEQLSEVLSVYLQKNGIVTESFALPSLALKRLESGSFDLVILDLTLPEQDGLELCKLITSLYDLPIIISSARGETHDKILGLGIGADDYLPKPYEPSELLARIRSVLRRYRKSTMATATATNENSLRVDEYGMRIYKGTAQLELTVAEYELLKLFIDNPQRILSRDFIAENVSSMRWDSTERSIDVIISRIRHKLCDDSKNPTYIKSVKGAGYKYIA